MSAVTGAQAMQSVTQSICDAHGHTSCGFTAFWQWALVFGCIQLVLGQLPSLHYFYAASVIGAAMSVGYSTTAVGISAGNLDGTYGHGTAGGLAFGSSADKA